MARSVSPRTLARLATTWLVLLCSALTALSGGVAAAGPAITEFVLPTGNSQPWTVAAGPDGNVWFTEFLGNNIGRITHAGTVM